MAGTLTVQNIEGPSSGSDANTVIMGSGQKLIVPEHVIGSATATYNTQQVITSTSFATSGLEVSYTAKKSTSKLLIRWDIPVELYDGGANSEVIGEFKLYKDSSAVGNAYVAITTMENVKRSGGNNAAAFYIDASDTSSHTYTCYVKTNGEQFTVFRYSLLGTLSVMEIAQ